MIENQEVELDTDVLDGLVEPLMHLVRNAVAHGIESPETRRLVGKPETGTITISVVNQETHVVLKVRDDGRGIAWATLKERAVEAGLIDPAAAASLGPDGLFFAVPPGPDHRQEADHERRQGVGMSIVKESVESRKGTISLETRPSGHDLFAQDTAGICFRPGIAGPNGRRSCRGAVEMG